MEAVEDYIKKYTRNYSNEILVNGDESYTNIPSKGEYHPWLTPDHARSVAEIARKETYDKIWYWLAEHINDYVVEGKGRDIDLMFDDIKQAMKDE